ncbi:hypothetical protein [Iodobacter fluviatilis]|uniref:Uncharacterized protein n=1 Tax=Iodobacter fluviatilis TaxID=537 RepID=A0A7G3G9M2_9NEIS|nr:hypothetical protein [Iodobacter fluviatilis]QBC43773.1 hypothetical protein C1H71_09575 [Iodobacter fluviatilis]
MQQSSAGRSLNEAKFNNLCSHYKDSSEIHFATIKQRDTLFYLLLAILSLFIVHSAYTDFFNKVVSELFKKNTYTELNEKVDLISTFLWLFVFGVSAKYFQTAGIIEKQYGYLHALEEQLEKFYRNTVIFTREGKFYLNKYPVLSKWMWFLYTIAFPLMILMCICFKAYTEISVVKLAGATIYINMVFGILVFITTVIYMFSLHFKK